MKIFFWMTGLLVMFASVASAETLTLRSGRVYEGEILEQTDTYVRIKTADGTYKIKMRMLEDDIAARLRGEEVAEPLDLAQFEIPRDPKEWETWFQGVEGYVKQTTDLLRLSHRIWVESVPQVNEALKRKNNSKALEISRKTAGHYRYLLRELNSLEAPEILKPYQRNVQKFFELQIRGMDVWAWGDQQAYLLNSKRALREIIEGLEYLNEVYARLHVPPSVLELLEYQIKMMKRLLEARYY